MRPSFPNISTIRQEDPILLRLVLFCLAEMPVADITFSNVHIDAAKGFEITPATDVTFLDSIINTDQGLALRLTGTTNVNTKGLSSRRSVAGVSLVERRPPPNDGSSTSTAE